MAARKKHAGLGSAAVSVHAAPVVTVAGHALESLLLKKRRRVAAPAVTVAAPDDDDDDDAPVRCGDDPTCRYLVCQYIKLLFVR